jgi:hypothetical protein
MQLDALTSMSFHSKTRLFFGRVKLPRNEWSENAAQEFRIITDLWETSPTDLWETSPTPMLRCAIRQSGSSPPWPSPKGKGVGITGNKKLGRRAN